MNKAQQEAFKKRAGLSFSEATSGDSKQEMPELYGFAGGYSAACADNEERVRGLVEALEKIAEYPMERSQEKSYGTCRAIASIALKAYRGE